MSYHRSAALLASALWRVARKDPVARLTIGAFAVLAALQAAPFLSSGQRLFLRESDIVDPPFIALVLLACWLGLRRIERRGERRFWLLLSVVYGCWMLASLLLTVGEEPMGPLVFYLGVETLFAAHYTVFVLAVTGQPHQPGGFRAARPGLSWLVIAALIFGLFTYFVLIPVVLNLGAHETVFPSSYLYLLLDALLVVRLTVLARGAGSQRWRLIYSALALTMVLSFVNDLRYSGLDLPGVAGSWGLAGAMLWSLQFVVAVLAVRLRHLPVGSEAAVTPSEPETRFARIRDQTLFIAVAFPVLHFLLYLSGLLDEAIRPARETWMVIWLMLMATVAVIQHRLLETSRRDLEQATSSMSAELSARREMEEQRREFQSALETRRREIEAKTAELERFTYVASHDLRSPLITIKGFVGVLERQLAAGDLGRMAQPIQRVEAAAGKMWRLLNELLELHRTGPEGREIGELAMGELVGEVVENLSGAIREHEVAVVIAPDLPRVRADRTRLLEVWQNLVENAVKYRGGESAPRVEIGWREDDGRPVFFVRDNGRGIDPADQEKVFELFRRLDHATEGTGVGLALARRIVEQHGGRLWVESAGRGRGATFHFTLGDVDDDPGDAPGVDRPEGRGRRPPA